MGKLHDVVGCNSRPFRNAVRWIFTNTLLQFGKSMSVLLHVICIVQSLGDDHMHQTQGERHISARIDGQIPVSALCRPRFVWIDDHQLGALAPGLFYERP